MKAINFLSGFLVVLCVINAAYACSIDIANVQCEYRPVSNDHKVSFMIYYYDTHGINGTLKNPSSGYNSDFSGPATGTGVMGGTYYAGAPQLTGTNIFTAGAYSAAGELCDLESVQVYCAPPYVPAPEFGSLAMAIAVVIAAPGFAYLLLRK